MKENILYIIFMSPLWLAIGNGIYHKVYDIEIDQPQEIKFEETFKDARQDLGKDGVFIWNGNKYTTLYKEEI